jgi:hypothetical protein
MGNMGVMREMGKNFCLLPLTTDQVNHSLHFSLEKYPTSDKNKN